MRSITLLLLFGTASAFDDCAPSDADVAGPFSCTFFNATDQEGVLIFGLVPEETVEGGFPVLAYAHGMTGSWAMTDSSLEHVCSHGFAVVFPHIRGPEEDSGLVTDPMGGFLIKAVDYIELVTTDPSSVLYGKIDPMKLVLGGHSMGASTTIMAGALLSAAGRAENILFSFALHPGLCGPIGPPPCFEHGSDRCSTWLADIDLDLAAGAAPFLLTTATNDGAFRPAPATAEEELACFVKGLDITEGQPRPGNPAIYAEFKEEVCDGCGGRQCGHNCPLFRDGLEGPQWPWVLAAMKLYAQQGGSAASACHEAYVGSGASSFRNSPDLAVVEVRE